MGGKSSKVAQIENYNLNKKKINEVMPDKLWFNDNNRLIWDYAFDVNHPDQKWLEKPFTFFGFPSSEKQICALVSNGAPLNVVENSINKAYARGEKHLQDTLVKARELAIRCLDIDIHGFQGYHVGTNIIDPGMAETIIKLGNKLFPTTFYEKLAANPVLPSETKQQKEVREKTNIEAVNKVFNAIKSNDVNNAIISFKEFVRNSDIHPLNRMHLLSTAFDIFSKKGGTLPSINRYDESGYYGKLGDQFCFKVIGEVLEGDLPPRVCQIIKAGGSRTLTGFNLRIAQREMDVEDIQFNEYESRLILGVNAYYDGKGIRGPGRWYDEETEHAEGRASPTAARFFKNYYNILERHSTMLSATHYEPYQSSLNNEKNGKLQR